MRAAHDIFTSHARFFFDAQCNLIGCLYHLYSSRLQELPAPLQADSEMHMGWFAMRIGQQPAGPFDNETDALSAAGLEGVRDV